MCQNWNYRIGIIEKIRPKLDIERSKKRTEPSIGKHPPIPNPKESTILVEQNLIMNKQMM